MTFWFCVQGFTVSDVCHAIATSFRQKISDFTANQAGDLRMTAQNRLDRGQKHAKISLRCFTDNDKQLTYKKSPHLNHNNSTVLVFSSQTTQDQYQDLIIGSCGVWANGRLQKFCLFHDDSLKQSHIEKIKSHTTKLTLPDDCIIDVRPREEFAEKIFFPQIYSSRAKCVGFDFAV